MPKIKNNILNAKKDYRNGSFPLFIKGNVNVYIF